MIGTTISHYKIIEKLGEGGMGVVYRAHDTTLDRDVALKFLPRDVSSSPEERGRFIHEAKAAASLTHPNIAVVHEIGEHPRSDGHGTDVFIAMEYIEGKTIVGTIHESPLPLNTVIPIIIQIAEGLHAAHEKGIVHRDIKSSNIIVTSNGKVKILDFGLAHKSGLSRLTKTGSTVGTAAYMSPEQARGEKLDHRSDLWALGVVLYEMVTGKLPFKGEHEAAILYSVVNEQPQSIQTFVSDASPELIHILSRALEKDPSERYQSAADMLIDLRRLKKDTSRTGFPPVSGDMKKRLKRGTRIVLAAVFLAVLSTVVYIYLTHGGAEINPAFTSRNLQVPFDRVSGFAGISRDGKWVVFGARDRVKKWDLYVMSSAGGEVRQLTSDSLRESGPNISPDGNSVVYQRLLVGAPIGTMEICSVPFNGGVNRKLGVGQTPKWSPDGKRIGYLGTPGNSFWTMAPDGTDKHLMFTDSTNRASNTYAAFAWSPDGRSIAWVRGNRNGYSEVLIRDLATGNEKVVLSDTTVKNEICWAPNDQLIYSSSINDEKHLWMIPAEGGDQVQITKGSSGIDFPMLSADGRLLIFSQESTTGHLWLGSLDGSMRREEIFTTDRYFEFPDISPDGQIVVFGMASSSFGSTVRHLFTLNRDGSGIRQITSGEISCFKPRWSPDGRMISYYSKGRFEPQDSFKVLVINPFTLDVPRFVAYGGNQIWVDSVTLEFQRGGNYQLGAHSSRGWWQGYLDGRDPKRFSKDSIFANTICNGQYVIWKDEHSRAETGRNPRRVCRSEDWDEIGPVNSDTLPKTSAGYNPNYDALYGRRGLDIIRIFFRDWKMERLNVNVQGIDTLNFFIRTTSDGKEMVYKTTETANKLGVIENLFR